jgi:hypothetical protein
MNETSTPVMPTIQSELENVRKVVSEIENKLGHSQDNPCECVEPNNKLVDLRGQIISIAERLSSINEICNFIGK